MQKWIEWITMFHFTEKSAIDLRKVQIQLWSLHYIKYIYHIKYIILVILTYNRIIFDNFFGELLLPKLLSILKTNKWMKFLNLTKIPYRKGEYLVLQYTWSKKFPQLSLKLSSLWRFKAKFSPGLMKISFIFFLFQHNVRLSY